MNSFGQESCDVGILSYLFIIKRLYKNLHSLSLSSLIYDDASNQTKCLDIDNYLTCMYATRTQANEHMGTILFSYIS